MGRGTSQNRPGGTPTWGSQMGFQGQGAFPGQGSGASGGLSAMAQGRGLLGSFPGQANGGQFPGPMAFPGGGGQPPMMPQQGSQPTPLPQQANAGPAWARENFPGNGNPAFLRDSFPGQGTPAWMRDDNVPQQVMPQLPPPVAQQAAPQSLPSLSNNEMAARLRASGAPWFSR